MDEARRDLKSQHHWISSEPNAFAGKIVHPMLLVRSSEMNNIENLESISGFVLFREQADYGRKGAMGRSSPPLERQVCVSSHES